MQVFEEFETEAEKEPEVQNNNVVKISKLVDRAMNGTHTEWEFIKTYDEMITALTAISATSKVIKGFKKSTRALYKEYIKLVKKNSSNLDLVLSLRELTRTINFYKEELNILDDMLDEFRVYARAGHMLEIVTGDIRKVEDLYDFRKPKPSSM